MAPPQRLCDSRPSQKRLASVFHTLTHPCSLPSAESRSQGGSHRWGLRQKPLWPGGPLCSHQEGGWLSGAEDGAAPEALWLSPVPETAGLCIPHPHPCSLPSAESRRQGGSRRGLRHKPLGPGGPLCSHQEGGWLSGAEDGAASEADTTYSSREKSTKKTFQLFTTIFQTQGDPSL